MFKKKHSLETKRKISETLKRIYKDKTKHPHFGKERSLETKRKLSLKNTGKKLSMETKKKMGLAHWKGGCNKYYYRIARALYYEHHTNIICDHCGTIKNICIHHIDGDYKNNNIENLQALCKSCHHKYHRKKDMPDINMKYSDLSKVKAYEM